MRSQSLFGFLKTAGGGSVTYLVSDNLEYANNSAMTSGGWTLTGSPVAGYTTSPAPLQGTYSFTSSAITDYGEKTFASSADCNIYFLFNAPTSLANNPQILRVVDGSSNVLSRVVVLAAGQVRVTDSSGTALATSSSGIVSTGSTYGIWIRYVKGSGANGICEIYVSGAGNETKPGSAAVSTAAGDWAANVAGIRLLSVATDQIIFDKVRVADTQIIGSDPA